MKMSDIKLPMMYANTKGSTTDAKTNISSSALYKYLGWTKSRRTGTNATAGVCKDGVPLLLYLDIFKNFFANTQESKFYMISNVGSEPTIKAAFGGTPSADYKLPTTGLKVTLKNTDTVSITTPSSIKNYKDAWSSITFAIRDNTIGNGTQVTADQLTTDATKGTIVLNNFSKLYRNGGTLISILLNNTAAFGAFLKQYNLEILDQIRDVILHKKGNEILILEGSEMGDDQNGSEELATFINDLKKAKRKN